MKDRYREALAAGERAGAAYELQPPRRAPAGTLGIALAKRSGNSLEFRDHREYQPGDDLRHIDWNAFARSDNLNVKLYQEEVSPHLDIVLDNSRSMALEGSRKDEAALGLAALFATAARNAGFPHALWIAAGEQRRLECGGGPPLTWEGIGFDEPGNPSEAFARLGPGWRAFGMRVFISDLLWSGDPQRALHTLAERAASLVVLQVVGRADAQPPGRGSLRLVDSETGELQEVFLDAGAERRYRDAFARHQQNWHRAARQAGATLLTAVAEEVVGNWHIEGLAAAGVLVAAGVAGVAGIPSAAGTLGLHSV